ncbi:MAG: hypothetical protein ACYSWU_29510, partial [Planctomycetota bacterium]
CFKDRPKVPRDDSLERAFLAAGQQLKPSLVPDRRNYGFHPTRQWELDFAWVNQRVAVEIQGGVGRGRKRYKHIDPKGYRDDCEKANEALLLGWRVFRFTSDDMKERPVQCAEMVAQLLETSDE